MTRVLIDDVLRMLPWLLVGFAFSVWGMLFLWIGYVRGHNRGIKDRPEVQKDAFARAVHERTVAQERLESAEKVIRYYKTVIDQLAANRDEEPRLRVARG